MAAGAVCEEGVLLVVVACLENVCVCERESERESETERESDR